jgi:hypothetical protein
MTKKHLLIICCSIGLTVGSSYWFFKDSQESDAVAPVVGNETGKSSVVNGSVAPVVGKSSSAEASERPPVQATKQRLPVPATIHGLVLLAPRQSVADHGSQEASHQARSIF